MLIRTLPDAGSVGPPGLNPVRTSVEMVGGGAQPRTSWKSVRGQRQVQGHCIKIYSELREVCGGGGRRYLSMNFTGQVCCEAVWKADGWENMPAKWHEPGAKWETQATGSEGQTRAVGLGSATWQGSHGHGPWAESGH